MPCHGDPPSPLASGAVAWLGKRLVTIWARSGTEPGQSLACKYLACLHIGNRLPKEESSWLWKLDRWTRTWW